MATTTNTSTDVDGDTNMVSINNSNNNRKKVMIYVKQNSNLNLNTNHKIYNIINNEFAKYINKKDQYIVIGYIRQNTKNTYYKSLRMSVINIILLFYHMIPKNWYNETTLKESFIESFPNNVLYSSTDGPAGSSNSRVALNISPLEQISHGKFIYIFYIIKRMSGFPSVIVFGIDSREMQLWTRHDIEYGIKSNRICNDGKDILITKDIIQIILDYNKHQLLIKINNKTNKIRTLKKNKIYIPYIIMWGKGHLVQLIWTS